MVHSDLTEALTSKIERDFIKKNTIFFDIQPYGFKNFKLWFNLKIA